MSNRTKGKIFALIDYLIISLSSLCIELIALRPLNLGKYRSWIVQAHPLEQALIMIILLVHYVMVMYKTGFSKTGVTIPDNKKYKVSLYYCLGMSCTFIFLFFLKPYLYKKFTRYVPTEILDHYLNLLYQLYLFLVIFSGLRVPFKFDYYQSFYYKYKRSYAYYIFIATLPLSLFFSMLLSEMARRL